MRISLFFTAALMLIGPAAHAQTPSIRWSIAPQGTRDGTELQLTIESRWSPGSDSIWSDSRTIGELSGLTAAQLRGPTQQAHFALVRDAGRLDCSGTAGGLTGRGSCIVTSNPAFAGYLAARGMGRPTQQQIFSLMMSGVGRDLIEAMDQLGYAKPSIEQLTSMGVHGVTPAFVRGLATSGYRLQSADDLVTFRIHGVNVDYIKGMAAAGPKLRNLPASDLSACASTGCSLTMSSRWRRSGPPFPVSPPRTSSRSGFTV